MRVAGQGEGDASGSKRLRSVVLCYAKRTRFNDNEFFHAVMALASFRGGVGRQGYGLDFEVFEEAGRAGEDGSPCFFLGIYVGIYVPLLAGCWDSEER